MCHTKRFALCFALVLMSQMMLAPAAMAAEVQPSNGRLFGGGSAEHSFGGGRMRIDGETGRGRSGSSDTTYYTGSFYEMMNLAEGIYGIGKAVYNGITGLAGVMKSNTAESDGYISTAAQQSMTTAVNSTLGTVYLTDTGWIIPVAYAGKAYTYNEYNVYETYGYTYPQYTTGKMLINPYYMAKNTTINIESIESVLLTVPYSGYVTVIISSTSGIENGEFIKATSNYKNRTAVEKGAIIYSDSVKLSKQITDSGGYAKFSTNGEWCFYSVRACILYEPVFNDYINTMQSIGGASSRAGSMSDIYGYINGDGNYVLSGENTIVNEGAKTYYNPVTDNSETINNWQYDYSTRTYTITTNTGDTVTVNYGDEYITINEGDTVYNVYYVIGESEFEEKPGASPSPGATPEPGASPSPNPGTSPSPGASPTPNPGGSGGGDDDGGNWFTDSLGWIWDVIAGFFGFIFDGIGVLLGKLGAQLGKLALQALELFQYIPTLFGGFMDFLGGFFWFLPPDLSSVLTFGILTVVLVSIIKVVFFR